MLRCLPPSLKLDWYMRPTLLVASERRPAKLFLPLRVKEVFKAPVPT